MTRQRVLWTACPHGKATDGKLRVAVHVAPQLFPTGNKVSTLAEFHDWENWPATQVSFEVKIGASTYSAEIASAAPSLPLWKSLFPASTPVDPYEYTSPTASPLYSYPAGFVRRFFQSTYTALMNTSPVGGWPSFQEVTSDAGLGQLPLNGRLLEDEIGSVKAMFPKGGGPIPPGKGPNPRSDLVQAYLFLQPLTTPAKGQTYGETAPPPVPQFDFHQAVSLLGRHPALLRLFGLVYELEIPRPSGLSGVHPVSVIPSWQPKPKHTTDIKPQTMTNLAEWLPAHRTSDPEIAAGYLRFSDPDYEVVEMDLDGATLKSFNFVQGVQNANTEMRSADTPNNYAVPSLRSAGLSVAKAGNALSLYQNWENNNSFNAAIEASPPGAVTLYFEDIAQGYRIDVWSKARGRWFQLCARTGAKNPGLGGYGIGSPPTVVPVPNGDEGWVEPATTQSSTPSGPNPPVYVPEYLMRWAGWSLVGARPGKHLSDIPSDGLEPNSPNSADGNLQIQIDYAATPGTLPTLRFGGTYRFRARAVDLAGNSVPFTKTGGFTWATPEVTYRRLEPVPSPVLVPTAPRTPGEHLENLVIRSNYDIPNNDPSIVACERHIAPPSTGEDMAETHGVLDGPGGHPEASSYALIADRDGLTYKSPAVRKLYGGKVDDQPMNGKNEWIYYPPQLSPSSSHPAFGVPYLPDVLSRGVTLFNLPGKKDGFVRVPFDSIGAWPERRAVRLVVRAGSGAPLLPAVQDIDGVIEVKAPKASITPVLFSSYIAPADLEVMGLWQWLVAAGKATPAMRSLILHRLHYMFTPFRELVIVHAVRQPLAPPRIDKLSVQRPYGGTYALLSGVATSQVQSTVRTDVIAAWADPYDDGKSKQGTVPLDKTSRVDEINLSLGQSNVLALDKIRHDFGDTKHHEVFYSALSTTRFLEYFAETVVKTLSGTASTVFSSAGFAPGTLDVRAADDTATIYKSGVDFTEDDKKGSIARLSGGSIPDGESLQVQFVAPPVTRSSLEKLAKPQTPFGYLLSIPSTARPPAPDVRYLIPAWNWVTQPSTTNPSSSRVGNVLRVYLGRPWFESGIGELLGVVVADPPPGVGLPPRLQPFVSGFGSDPVFVTGPVGTAKVNDFGLAKHIGKSLQLEEQTGTVGWVDVAGHEVQWDEERLLWFADISIGAGQSYFPFVKLALVRYQPASLKGVEVSRVVQADFIQLAPNRSMGLTYPSTTQVNIEVLGPGYFETTSRATPDTMRAYLQLKVVATSDPDLQWIIDPSQPDGVLLTISSQTETLTQWNGTLTLPQARGTTPYRILVAEFEQHTVVRAGNLASKVTYLDAIEI